jgi:hypothetical protein
MKHVVGITERTDQLTREFGHMGAGINILHTEGNVSIQAGGDIVAGNKTVINNIIQRLARELTTTPYKFLGVSVAP